MACHRPDKFAHPTREAAYEHLAAMRRAGKATPAMGVYRCEDHWHIGNLVRVLTPLPAKPRKRNSHIGSAKRRNRRRVA